MVQSEVQSFRATLREMVRELGMLSRKASGTELSPLQSHILIELSNQPNGCTELASKLCVEKASMSRALRNLSDEGYLLKENDAQDGRASLYRLSDFGRQLLSTLEKNADRFIVEALATSSDEEIQVLRKTLLQFSSRLRNARRHRESNLIIRRLKLEDNYSIAKIIRNSFLENKIEHLEGVSLHDPELDSLSEAYEDYGFGYWVAEVNGHVVGGAGLAPLVGEVGVCEVQKFFFKREVHGMGLGRKMISFIISQASNMGYNSCYLETLQQLVPAICLYEAFGFRHIPARLGNTGHDSCDVYMLKNL